MKVAKKFILRGLIAAGFGPLILAIVYYCLHQAGIITNLSVNEVAWGFFLLFCLPLFKVEQELSLQLKNFL